MPAIPRDPSPESTLALLRDPYGFIGGRCRRLGSDVFRTRLLLGETICMRGSEAAELFYDESRFERKGAMPMRFQKTLVGVGGVQGLDGEAHRQRKHMHLALLGSERVKRLAEAAASEWRAAAARSRGREVVLYEEAQAILGRAVCGWAGVPLAEADAARRTRELAAMFDGAGALGPRHWRARRARRSAERWLAGVVEAIRGGRLAAAPDTAAHGIAWHRERGGEPLAPRIAAVELLNVLRPVVAVSVFVTHLAAALAAHPAWRERLAGGAAGDAELFVQETRRFFPFFPFAGARTRRAFTWCGYAFPAGRRVLLDLYGTNHDPRAWRDPEAFRPERFRERRPGLFDFVPQGGGRREETHRCAGEDVTVALMHVALDFLARRLAYELPPQDLSLERARIPALPRSRVRMREVRLLA